MIQVFGPFVVTSFFCSIFGVGSGNRKKEKLEKLWVQPIADNSINSVKERDIEFNED